MIKELINEHFAVCSRTHVHHEPVLNIYEANTLRYAAGYIPRALRKKIQKSAEPLKDQLILCLLDLLDDGEEEHVESHEWIVNIDRGGLCHINNTWSFKLDVTFKMTRNQPFLKYSLHSWTMKVSSSTGQ